MITQDKLLNRDNLINEDQLKENIKKLYEKCLIK